jgi:hypothetical protein
MAISPIGLVMCHVRVNVPGEGPRASGKLVRWSRVQIGELDVEAGGGHRLVSVQVEQQVLRAIDADVDRVIGFAIALLAAIDGRPIPDPDAAVGGSATRASRAARAGPEADIARFGAVILILTACSSTPRSGGTRFVRPSPPGSTAPGPRTSVGPSWGRPRDSGPRSWPIDCG